MVIRKALVALASAGLVFGSTAAAAAPVAVDGVRDASPVGEAENLSFAWIVGILILIGVIGVIAADGNEDLPTSP
jgi:hypothetical protein